MYKPHALVAFGGTLGATNATGKVEQWQCTLRVSEAPVITDVQLDSISNPLTDPVAYMNWVAPNLLTQYKALHGVGTTAGILGTATLEWLKVNNVGPLPNGKFGYTSQITNETFWTAANAGGVNTLGQCSIITLCGSLRTNLLSKGVASHGRMYLPVNVPASPQSFVSTAFRDAAAVLYKDIVSVFKTDGNGTYPHPVQPCIHSPGSAKNGHVGRFAPINYVVVGDVMDTVRRRKLQLVESYSAHVAV